VITRAALLLLLIAGSQDLRKKLKMALMSHTVVSVDNQTLEFLRNGAPYIVFRMVSRVWCYNCI